MDISSIPPPIVTNALPQDASAKAVPNVQAMAPLVQNAVAPTPKSEKFNQTRSNKDKAKDNRDGRSRRDEEEPESDKPEHSVNLSV